jgi:hypothetical protein
VGESAVRSRNKKGQESGTTSQPLVIRRRILNTSIVVSAKGYANADKVLSDELRG